MIYSTKRFANITKSMSKLVNKAKKEIIEAANTKNKEIARKSGKNGETKSVHAFQHEHKG